MEGSIKDLAKYRIDTAKENLEISKDLLDDDKLKFAMNRSYYAIFHAIRAVNALDGFDSSKHKGVISYFNQEYIKTGKFPKELSKMIMNAMEIRQKSDYDDFYIISRQDARKQVENADYIIGLVEAYFKEMKIYPE